MTMTGDSLGRSAVAREVVPTSRQEHLLEARRQVHED